MNCLKVAKKQLPRGVFTLSLDLELAWGTRGRPKASQVGPYLDGTRRAIRGLLDLCERYEVPATWAVVGALLLRTSHGATRHPWLSAPEFNNVPPGNSESQPHWYADDILEHILACPVKQEIGCHSLTHRFVDRSPAGRESFLRELRRFRELFERLGWEKPISFIFPKAHMAHYDVLAEMGFRCFRGPESKWFESLPGEITPAAFRLLDARLSLAPGVDHPTHLPEGIWRIPSSQFYSPLMSVGRYVTVEARVRKAMKGLYRAAEFGGVFHLWTHPFNLGLSKELIAGLETIFSTAAKLREANKLEILPMGAIARRLDGEDTSVQAERPALAAS